MKYIEQFFNDLKNKFDSQSPNDYRFWYWGNCFEEKFKNQNNLPSDHDYVKDSFTIISVTKNELDIFIKEGYLDLLTQCPKSLNNYSGAIYFYKIINEKIKVL